MNPSFTEIKSFVESFLQAEADAKNAANFPDLELMKDALDALNSFCTEELHNKSGILLPTSLEPLETYSQENNYVPQTLYKISLYQNLNYGEVFLAYVGRFVQYHCYFIHQVHQKWKITERFDFTNDFWRTNHSKKRLWIEFGGRKLLNFENVGRFVESERYSSPWHLEEILEDFNKQT